MRWVTVVVKLNDDYKFGLAHLVLRAIAFTIGGTSSRHPVSEDNHLNSDIYKGYSNYGIEATWCTRITENDERLSASCNTYPSETRTTEVIIYRSPNDSLKVLTIGLVRYFSTVLTPVLISTVAVMPGWISMGSSGRFLSALPVVLIWTR